MRISESEHKMVVDERNKLRRTNARLIDLISHHSVCLHCENYETPLCNMNPCAFKLKPLESSHAAGGMKPDY